MNLKNIALNTDSYKASMHCQYPPGTQRVFSYVESRGGKYPKTVFFGLQYYLMEYLMTPFTRRDIDEAAKFWADHGEPFNKQAWINMLAKHRGFFPVRIRAVPEGSVVPTNNVLVTIENTDPEFPWATTWLETGILRAAWYGSTVATNAWSIRNVIRSYLEKTGDVNGLNFKHHDFGARGVSSFESAGIGDMAFLAAGSMGSDTVTGALFAMKYYNAVKPSFSIPAAEHSTITSWGRENEVEAYRNMLKQFAKPGAPVAVVSDSYNIYQAVENHWGRTLKQEVIDSGAVVIIRPDSGVPSEVVADCLVMLNNAYGHTVNSKGYKVLNNMRVIQGDGITEESIKDILEKITELGYSTDNVAFGQGGALLQQLDRDTNKWAMKCSAIEVNNQWRDVYKDPVTDTGKRSKKGRVTLFQDKYTGEYTSAPFVPGKPDALVTVYENGVLTKRWNFDEVRQRANAEEK